jgi:hypothetical protein
MLNLAERAAKCALHQAFDLDLPVVLKNRPESCDNAGCLET